MAMENGSQAYDLSLFEPRQAKVVELKPNKKMQKAQTRKQTVQSLLNMVSTLAVAIVAVTVMCMMVAGRVRMTELQSEIKAADKQLTELDSEYRRMTAELEGRKTAGSVEEYAREELDMHKTDTYVVVETEEGDRAVVPEEEPASILEKIGSAIMNFFK